MTNPEIEKMFPIVSVYGLPTAPDGAQTVQEATRESSDVPATFDPVPDDFDPRTLLAIVELPTSSPNGYQTADTRFLDRHPALLAIASKVVRLGTIVAAKAIDCLPPPKLPDQRITKKPAKDNLPKVWQGSLYGKTTDVNRLPTIGSQRDSLDEEFVGSE